jgi:hypothetical protein
LQQSLRENVDKRKKSPGADRCRSTAALVKQKRRAGVAARN